jgi:hypothetical protein
MTDSAIDYPNLVDEALRGVARTVLTRVAEEGLPGEHHFYVSFKTDHPDVGLSPALRDVYPEEMTIVLQNQFWDLSVDDEGFEVMLRFDGQPQHLRIPWLALKSFVDPEAEFGLRFDSHQPELAGADEEDTAESRPRGSGEVVSLEDFRRRDD